MRRYVLIAVKIINSFKLTLPDGCTECPTKISKAFRARAHWPLCLATGGRVFVVDPSTLGRHVAATCMLCMQTLCLWRGRATACRTLEPQLQCARQSLKIMVSYGNKYPRNKSAATCG